MYNITIEETKTVRKMVSGDYTKGAGNDPNDPDGNWGYSPDREMDVEKTITIYEQHFENLDVQAIIKAGNGL